MNFDCHYCDKELEETGGLLFSPPDADDIVKKHHICVDCYVTISAGAIVIIYNSLEQENKELKEHIKALDFKLEGEKKVNQLVKEKNERLEKLLESHIKSSNEEKERLHENIEVYAGENKELREVIKDLHVKAVSMLKKIAGLFLITLIFVAGVSVYQSGVIKEMTKDKDKTSEIYKKEIKALNDKKCKPKKKVKKSETKTAKKVTYSGRASWYGSGTRTATGEAFNPNGHTMATMNRSLFGKRAKVTNVANGKSVVVKINDTGNFGKNNTAGIKPRVADLSKGAFRKIATLSTGVISVRVKILT